MKRALFLGNSHVASLKNAYDQAAGPSRFGASFFCAPAADITFTKVADGRLSPAAETSMSEDALTYFYVDGRPEYHDLYFRQRKPLADVEAMFLQTGQKPAAELEALDAIFYVVGVSPFDFVRLGEDVSPLAPALRTLLLDRVIGSGFGLRSQVEAIREAHPDIRHYFVGTPLKFGRVRKLSSVEREIVDFKRAQVAALAGQYLFDDVFMPGEAVLQPNLLSTREEFFANGREEAEDFQGGAKTRSDRRHVNGKYGAHVLESFVQKHLQ